MSHDIAEATPETIFVPLTARPATFMKLPLSAVQVANNYRESLDKAELKNLAQNILAVGLVQPVAAYPLAEPKNGKTHGLTAGFRRFAAHELAGLTEIEAVVRPMSEEEAALLRLVENVQRANPHPADEAKAVAGLGKLNYSRADIAAQMGKSPKWVAQRQAVAELLPVWFKMLRENKLTLGAAEEIARWPLDVQQRLSEKYPAGVSESLLTYDSVRRAIGAEQHVLSGAPWKLTDETLVPAAGACSTCPKRTGCSPDLFAANEIGKRDSCRDGACWATKLDAQVTRLLADNSSDDQPALRISSNWSGEIGKSLGRGRYEVVKKKKEGQPAVLVDGPEAGHLRYVKVSGPTLSVSLGGMPLDGTPVVPRGQQMKDSRRKRLLLQAEKQVLAERIMLRAQDENPEVARPMVAALLVDMITEAVMRGRIKSDDLTLIRLQAVWKWENLPENRSHSEVKAWVREQVKASCPNDDTAKMVFLLLFLKVNHDLGGEYSNVQRELAGRIGQPGILDNLEPDTQAKLRSEYDPATLRRHKQAA